MFGVLIENCQSREWKHHSRMKFKWHTHTRWCPQLSFWNFKSMCLIVLLLTTIIS